MKHGGSLLRSQQPATEKYPFFKIHRNIFLRPIFRIGTILSSFLIRILYALFMPPMHATCLIHNLFRDWISLIIFGEEHKPWSSSVLNYFQHPITSSLLGPDIPSARSY
jgi:hypothetical protein